MQTFDPTSLPIPSSMTVSSSNITLVHQLVNQLHTDSMRQGMATLCELIDKAADGQLRREDVTDDLTSATDRLEAYTRMFMALVSTTFFDDVEEGEDDTLPEDSIDLLVEMFMNVSLFGTDDEVSMMLDTFSERATITAPSASTSTVN